MIEIDFKVLEERLRNTPEGEWEEAVADTLKTLRHTIMDSLNKYRVIHVEMPVNRDEVAVTVRFTGRELVTFGHEIVESRMKQATEKVKERVNG